jgi:hypothetical protein
MPRGRIRTGRRHRDKGPSHGRRGRRRRCGDRRPRAGRDRGAVGSRRYLRDAELRRTGTSELAIASLEGVEDQCNNAVGRRRLRFWAGCGVHPQRNPAARRRSGLRTLRYAASDSASGLSRVDVLLNESVVASRDLTPSCRYADFAVCPTSDDDTLQIDTRAGPNGSYDLAVRVRDAAGNEQVVHGERPVEVANASPVESSSLFPYALVVRFKGSSRSKLTVPYGRRVSVRGRLTQGAQPVGAGIPLDVMERPDRRGAVEKPTRTVMTKADGSFSIGLATSRPSRVVRLAYRPAGGGQVASQALKLRVRAAARVRASLRGRVVHFSGSESGYGYLSSRSRAVTLRVR